MILYDFIVMLPGLVILGAAGSIAWLCRQDLAAFLKDVLRLK